VKQAQHVRFGGISAVVFAAALLVAASAFAAGEPKIASGRTAATSWVLRAADMPSAPGFVTVCFQLVTNGRGPARDQCSQFSLAPDSPADTLFGISNRGEEACPGFGLEYGAVVGTARTVDLTPTGGKSIRTATIPPPHGLMSSVRFYVAKVPCTTLSPKLVARTASGRVVGRLSF
jgi:hypothetical protein